MRTLGKHSACGRSPTFVEATETKQKSQEWMALKHSHDIRWDAMMERMAPYPPLQMPPLASEAVISTAVPAALTRAFNECGGAEIPAGLCARRGQ